MASEALAQGAREGQLELFAFWGCPEQISLEVLKPKTGVLRASSFSSHLCFPIEDTEITISPRGVMFLGSVGASESSYVVFIWKTFNLT